MKPEEQLIAAGWLQAPDGRWYHSQAPAPVLVELKEAVRRSKIGKLPKKRTHGHGEVYI